MEKMDFSIKIDAPVKTVWHTMLDDETYRKWTEVFAKGSHYEGDWSQGSKILFLAPHDGEMSGMVSRIAENRPYEFISIKHVGLVADGEEVTDSNEVRKWAGALENYTFHDLGDKTRVVVEMDIDEEHREMFEELWPEALQKLKVLAENSLTSTAAP